MDEEEEDQMSSRDDILKRVGAALASLAKRAPLPDWSSALVAPAPGSASDVVFEERLQAVHGMTFRSWSGLFDWLKAGGHTHGYCDPKLLPEIDAARLVGFTIETTFDRTRVDDYAFGITEATAAVAETGSLILTDAGTSRRLGALAPWVHVAVLRKATIHATLSEAVAALPKDPNVIWVTGPSKTADVEGILIEGVHGPGVQIALLL